MTTAAMRIFVAGFQHESNSFAPSPADWAAFEAGSMLPAVLHGAAMLEGHVGGSLPISGFIRAARSRDHRLRPSLWAGAAPSAPLTAHAFARIADTVCGDAEAELRDGGFDAVYLDLHGAAMAAGADDAEGVLLQRLRRVIGRDRPLVASLDLHANVTSTMLHEANALTVYRTYPHIDMPETGERALALLERLHAAGPRAPWHTHARRLPFLLPLGTQCTSMAPAQGVMRRRAALEAAHGAALNVAMGFPAADFDGCGPVVFGHGTDRAALHEAVDALHDEMVALRPAWRIELLGADEAVAQALAAPAQGGPVVIADTQDNPGAGGDANTTGMLHALLRQQAGPRTGGRAAIGLLFDPETAHAAHAAGLGARLLRPVGRSVTGFDGRPTDAPVQREATVRALHGGDLTLHGPMTAGQRYRLGPCARLDIDGVQVLVASGRSQMLDLDLYRFLGIEPGEMRVLVNKSSVHFRAAFAPLASRILVAKARGPVAADPADLPWRHLPPGLAPRP